jgi:hypothetical protein
VAPDETRRPELKGGVTFYLERRRGPGQVVHTGVVGGSGREEE